MERWAKLDNQRQGQAEFDTEEGEDAESAGLRCHKCGRIFARPSQYTP